MSIYNINEVDIYKAESNINLVKKYDEITIRHLTIKQIQSVKADPKSLFKIDDKPVYRCKLVAKITNIEHQENKLVLTLDDYTSKPKCQCIKAYLTPEQTMYNTISLTEQFAVQFSYSTITIIINDIFNIYIE